MATEQEIMQEIIDTDNDIKFARAQLNDYKNKIIEAETSFIGFKLKKEKLLEQLRVLRNSSVHSNEIQNAYEKDIERFRQILPELLKK